MLFIIFCRFSILESNASPLNLKLIKIINLRFRVGWLPDEVINAFIHITISNAENALYCGLTDSLLKVSHSRTCGKTRTYWKEDSS